MLKTKVADITWIFQPKNVAAVTEAWEDCEKIICNVGNNRKSRWEQTSLLQETRLLQNNEFSVVVL